MGKRKLPTTKERKLIHLRLAVDSALNWDVTPEEIRKVVEEVIREEANDE